jgi:hypothetical protein
MNPMSLLAQDEPQKEPMPGPQKMGCAHCHNLPFGAHRFAMVMGTLVLVLSAYVVIASARLGLPQGQPFLSLVSTALASK